MRTTIVAIALVALATNGATADIPLWQSTASSLGASYLATGIAAPTEADIGTFDISTNGGVTYEFIYNADAGGASSAFMGSLNPPVGDGFGLKLDQWNQTGKFGATAFGVADYNSGVDYILNTDTHIAYVADGTDLHMYVNGSFANTMAGAGAFALSGLTGLGHAYNHGNSGSVDPLNGELLGVAVYDSALDANQVLGTYTAFTVPEPATASLLGMVALLGLTVRRRRRV